MKKLFLFIVASFALASCGKNDGNDDGGDWYLGGIVGEYETFTIEIDAKEDWEGIAYMLAPGWFTFSPTKGTAGKQTITFRVSTQMLPVDFRLYPMNFNSEDESMVGFIYGLSDISTMEFAGEIVTKIDISDLTVLEHFHLFYPNGLPNLRELTMRRDQNIYKAHGETPVNIEDLPWEVNFK